MGLKSISTTYRGLEETRKAASPVPDSSSVLSNYCLLSSVTLEVREWCPFESFRMGGTECSLGQVSCLKAKCWVSSRNGDADALVACWSLLQTREVSPAGRWEVPARAVDEKHTAGLDIGGYWGSVCPGRWEAGFGPLPFSTLQGRWTTSRLTERRGSFPLAFVSHPPGLTRGGLLNTTLVAGSVFSDSSV